MNQNYQYVNSSSTGLGAAIEKNAARSRRSKLIVRSLARFGHQPTLRWIYRSSLLSLASLESLELLLVLACPYPRKTSRRRLHRLLLVAAATPTTPRNKRILMTQVLSSRTADSIRHSMEWPIRPKALYCQSVATHWVRPLPSLTCGLVNPCYRFGHQGHPGAVADLR